MKKTYIMPAVTATAVQMQSLMTGSNPTGSQVYTDPTTEGANENEKGLARRRSVWDDEEEQAEEEFGY